MMSQSKKRKMKQVKNNKNVMQKMVTDIFCDNKISQFIIDSYQIINYIRMNIKENYMIYFNLKL